MECSRIILVVKVYKKLNHSSKQKGTSPLPFTPLTFDLRNSPSRNFTLPFYPYPFTSTPLHPLSLELIGRVIFSNHIPVQPIPLCEVYLSLIDLSTLDSETFESIPISVIAEGSALQAESTPTQTSVWLSYIQISEVPHRPRHTTFSEVPRSLTRFRLALRCSPYVSFTRQISAVIGRSLGVIEHISTTIHDISA